MKLDELQRLAEGAAPVPDWWSEHSLRDHLRVADGVCPECDPPFIAAMSPDTAKKLIAVAKVVEEAHALVQEFKTRWMALPPFAEKINRATREGMTMAHQPIMQAEERLRTALEELK